jgi:hypothetical protein
MAYRRNHLALNIRESEAGPAPLLRLKKQRTRPMSFGILPRFDRSEQSGRVCDEIRYHDGFR